VPVRRLAATALVLVFTAWAPASAQPEEPAATAQAPAEASSKPPEASQPMGPPDPLNRGTPRGAASGFLQAARDGDFDKAAEYLDLRRLSTRQREQEGPEFARKLATVLARTVVIDPENLSATNEGQAGDGLPAWQDRLARIKTKSGSVDVLLQRVPRQGDGVRIWKISSYTVAEIPDLYREFGSSFLEEWLPRPFFEVHLLEMQLWQWVSVLCLVFLAWLLSWLFATVVVRILGRLAARTQTGLDDRVVHLVRNPVRVLLAVLIFHLGTLPLGLALTARAWLVDIEKILVVVALTWLLLQLVDLAALAMQERLARNGEAGSAALVTPGKRTVRAIIVVLAALFLLDNLGFNVAALIAGLGVGGIAVALAAQKTVENLFGGVTILADRPVRVGDFCRFGDKIGTVEEIGLRSTRVRTLDRTLVTVPNAEFSSLQLENFAMRDRIRLTTVLGLRYETTNEQLRYVLARLREMLLAHPMIDPDPARVRFVGFGAYSLDLEVFAYARTSDWNEFLQIREDVYLRIMGIVEEAGTGFAFPSSTTYVGRDEGLDEKAAREAEARVANWRDESALPFPEFSPDQRAALLDTLDWPPEGSHGRPRRRPPSQGADE
jgi:MscS family membrane protein